MSCPNCRSTDTWDDVSGWGCNKCGWSSFGMLNTTRTPSNPRDQYEVENRPRDYDQMFGHDPSLNTNRAERERLLRESQARAREDNERIHREYKEEKAREARQRAAAEQEKQKVRDGYANARRH